MNDYFAFIVAEKASFPIDWMCRQLKVSRASFYRWCVSAKPTPTRARHDPGPPRPAGRARGARPHA